MDEDVIDALAAVFLRRLQNIINCPGSVFDIEEHILMLIVDTAVIIHDFEPTYDLRYFYRNSGFPEPYPIHDL